MTETDVIAASPSPLVRGDIVGALRSVGVGDGDILEVHCSLSAMGWVVGGALTVVDALLEAVGPTGTVCMPAHTSDNGDPSRWENPPVPESWWSIIGDHMPAFDRDRSPSRGMGAVAETFRTCPGTLRSSHPRHSHLASGPCAADIVSTHRLDGAFDTDSPLGRVHEMNGKVLLLGVGHENNSILHLAEHLVEWPGKRRIPQGTAMFIDGVRRWVTFDELDYDASDFTVVGTEIERLGVQTRAVVGATFATLVGARDAVEVARQVVGRRGA